MLKLQIILAILAVTYVITFICGFLQATPYNFLNYVFFFLLFVGGVFLIQETFRTPVTGATKISLGLTSVSTTGLFVFFVVYDLARLYGYEKISATTEGFLYLLTLLFWILVIVSLVLTMKSNVPETQ